MAREIKIGSDIVLTNVVFLGLTLSRFSQVLYKRVNVEHLTNDEKTRIITTEVCFNRNSKDEAQRCKCLALCTFAVVKMTQQDQRDRRIKLSREFWPLGQ